MVLWGYFVLVPVPTKDLVPDGAVSLLVSFLSGMLSLPLLGYMTWSRLTVYTSDTSRASSKWNESSRTGQPMWGHIGVLFVFLIFFFDHTLG